MNSSLGNLLRLDGLESIDGWSLSFAAAWAERNPFLVVVGCMVAAALAAWFYLCYQPEMRPQRRVALAALRAAILSLLVIMLADPVLRLSFSHAPRPLLWLLFDGTESMAIEDELEPAEQAALALPCSIVLRLSLVYGPTTPRGGNKTTTWLMIGENHGNRTRESKEREGGGSRIKRAEQRIKPSNESRDQL